MEQLLQIDGAIDFFLMTASMNVNWQGSSTDIVRDRVPTVAAAVNRQFGTNLDCMDIVLTWAKLRNLWETWVRATHYVPHMKVNFTTGEINIDDYAWDQLGRVVPGAEIFRRQPMISPNKVCSIFNRTPTGLAPEEHSSRRNNEVEEEEIEACMREVYQIDELKSSEIYIRFCLSIFKDPVIRETFDYLPNKILKYEYVIKKYNNEHVAH